MHGLGTNGRSIEVDNVAVDGPMVCAAEGLRLDPKRDGGGAPVLYIVIPLLHK